MQIKQIQVTYTRTHNLGNYSSLKPEVTLSATLDEGDDPKTCLDQLMALARAQIAAEVAKAQPAPAEKAF
jgi:hypothetical protein